MFLGSLDLQHWTRIGAMNCSHANSSPSPGGEGWGEGERSLKSYFASLVCGRFMESATVPVAAFGVSPNALCSSLLIDPWNLFAHWEFGHSGLVILSSLVILYVWWCLGFGVKRAWSLDFSRCSPRRHRDTQSIRMDIRSCSKHVRVKLILDNGLRLKKTPLGRVLS
jgi:hypothetical protein